jgi:hypothetical protein
MRIPLKLKHTARFFRPHPERLTDKANRKKAGDFGPVT